MADAGVQPILYGSIGAMFPDQSDYAVALYKFWQSLASAAAFLYAGSVSSEYQLLVREPRKECLSSAQSP